MILIVSPYRSINYFEDLSVHYSNIGIKVIMECDIVKYQKYSDELILFNLYEKIFLSRIEISFYKFFALSGSINFMFSSDCNCLYSNVLKLNNSKIENINFIFLLRNYDIFIDSNYDILFNDFIKKYYFIHDEYKKQFFIILFYIKVYNFLNTVKYFFYKIRKPSYRIYFFKKYIISKLNLF